MFGAALMQLAGFTKGIRQGVCSFNQSCYLDHLEKQKQVIGSLHQVLCVLDAILP
jgi:hypothetical protein